MRYFVVLLFFSVFFAQSGHAVTKQELLEAADHFPDELSQMMRLLASGMDHKNEKIRSFSIAYAEIILKGSGLDDVDSKWRPDAIRNGDIEYASFVASLARQSAVYDSEYSNLSHEVVSPLLDRLARPTEDERLKLQYSEILLDIAVGRVILHFGHPRFLGDSLITQINGNSAQETLIQLAKNSSVSIATNILLFLRLEYPRDGQLPKLLSEKLQSASKPERKKALEQLNSLPVRELSGAEKDMLTAGLSEGLLTLEQIGGITCSRIKAILGKPSDLIRPLDQLSTYF